MIYKVYYELDNGYRFEDIWSVICSDKPLTNNDEVKTFLHTFVHKRSDECVRRVYEVHPINCDVGNQLVLMKIEA